MPSTGTLELIQHIVGFENSALIGAFHAHRNLLDHGDPHSEAPGSL